MNLICDAEQNNCIAASMLREAAAWMNKQMKVISPSDPLGTVERDAHQIWKCRNKKNDTIFFSIAIFR